MLLKTKLKPATWLFTAFFVGRFISASFWGIFIDKYGRKSGLLLVLVLLTVCTFLLGLSFNFYYALIIRFLSGLCNGLSIIEKTLSTEICPEDMKPWSISVTNTIWSLGMTIGPFIGSSLYNLFPSLPMFASSLAVCLIGCVLIALSAVYFEETLDRNNISVTSIYKKANEIEETTSDIESPSVAKIPLDVAVKPNSGGIYEMLDILKLPNVLRIIIIFSTNTFYAAVLVSLIPFWIASNYEDGGLGFKHHDISDIFIYLTLPQLVLQIILYPIVQKRRGDFWLITRGHCAHIPLFFFLPFAHVFGKNSFTIQKAWITFWLFIRNLASFMNFAVLQRYGNDVISSQKRGKMNGIQITFSSFFQIVGTFLGGWLLSWSETNQLSYPFDYHFDFLLMCIVTMIALTIIYQLKFVNDERTNKLVSENNINDAENFELIDRK